MQNDSHTSEDEEEDERELDKPMQGRPYYDLPLDKIPPLPSAAFANIPKEKIEANRFLYSSIMNGLGPIKMKRILLDFDIIANPNAYYQILNQLIIPLFNLVQSSCEQSLSLSNNEKIASIDGSWSKIKFADFCIVELIDVKTTQIIDFQIVTTSELGLVHDNLTVVPSATPQSLEYHGVVKISERHALMTGTKYFVHDGDVKAVDHISKKLAANIIQRDDPNHKAKNLFSICFKSGPLYGLGDRLTNRFKAVLKKYKGEERAAKFRAYYDYLISPAADWDKREDETAKQQLKKVIEQAADTYHSLEYGMHTCYNESFHFVRNIYAPKTENFRKGWVFRVLVAILHWNHRRNFKILIKNLLMVPISTNYDVLYAENQMLRSVERNRERKLTSEYVKQKNEQKNKKKARCVSKNEDIEHKPGVNEEIIPVVKSKKFNKVEMFGKTQISFPQNWKSITYYAHFKSNTDMQTFLEAAKPLIYRCNNETHSVVLVAKKTPRDTCDRFLTTLRPEEMYHYLVTEENFENVLNEIPFGSNIEDPNEIQKTLEQKKAKSENKDKDFGTGLRRSTTTKQNVKSFKQNSPSQSVSSVSNAESQQSHVGKFILPQFSTQELSQSLKLRTIGEFNDLYTELNSDPIEAGYITQVQSVFTGVPVVVDKQDVFYIQQFENLEIDEIQEEIELPKIDIDDTIFDKDDPFEIEMVDDEEEELDEPKEQLLDYIVNMRFESGCENIDEIRNHVQSYLGQGYDIHYEEEDFPEIVKQRRKLIMWNFPSNSKTQSERVEQLSSFLYHQLYLNFVEELERKHKDDVRECNYFFQKRGIKFIRFLLKENIHVYEVENKHKELIYYIIDTERRNTARILIESCHHKEYNGSILWVGFVVKGDKELEQQHGEAIRRNNTIDEFE